VEQRENPLLIGKPVIVGADPKEGKGRGVVMGCSYEARKLGVHSALPISIAYRLCPNGVYLPPNFTRYEQASEQIIQLLRTFSEKLEQMSIDEAFLDITEKVSSFEEAAALADTIKREIREKAKLTCSIGIAPNKAIAKIASDFKKPNGLTSVPPQKIREFLDPLPVTKISGVGKKSSELLTQAGIVSIGQLASTHPSRLTEIFGKYGTRIWQIANGIDEEEVITSSAIKSISSETTFQEDVTDKTKVMQAFDSIIQDVHARVQSQRMLFRTIGIKVRLENFETFTRARTHTRYTNEKAIIEEHVKQLYREFENSPRKIRLVGVRVSSLISLDSEQESILRWANPNE
ncbi:MAG: DNA polymerase IV, partial [Candidatus Bathyarchaeia archaeon]